MMIPLKTVQKAIERDAFDEHTDEKKRPTIVSRFWKAC